MVFHLTLRADILYSPLTFADLTHPNSKVIWRLHEVMRLKVSYGRRELMTEFPSAGRPVTVAQILIALQRSHPDIYSTWCDRNEQLRASLPVFVNDQHVRYASGLETELQENDEVYIIPMIAGG
jgi:molybdopterin synthase sulfur carrier subunit